MIALLFRIFKKYLKNVNEKVKIKTSIQKEISRNLIVIFNYRILYFQFILVREIIPFFAHNVSSFIFIMEENKFVRVQLRKR